MIRGLWLRRVVAIIVLLGSVVAIAVISSATPPSSAAWVLIGIGDSLTHGTMNATNNSINTANAYLNRAAALLAQSISVIFSQPFLNLNETRMSPYEIPTNVAIDGEDSFSVDGLEYYKRAGTTESLPSPKYFADKLLPVQFQDLHDTVLFPINVYARQDTTQMQSAEWLLKRQNVGTNRALIVYYVGNNDSSTGALGFGGKNPTFMPLPVEQLQPVMPDVAALLQFAINLGIASAEPYTAANIDRNLTSLSDFAAQQSSLLHRLVNVANSPDRHIFILTLAYYSSVGYLMDSEDLEYYFRKINPSYTVPSSFKRVAPPGQPITNPTQGDRITLLTFGLMYALLNSGYSPSYINGVLEVNGQQRDGMVLSEAEQQSIITRINDFNATLRSIAGTLGPNVHVVDIGGYLSDVLTGKIKLVIGGKEISRKWIRGSSFSFDGVHPSYTGQALIANYLVNYMNGTLGFNAPMASLDAVASTDPYTDRDGDGFASGPNYTVPGITELLFLFKDPNDLDANVQVTLPPNVWQTIAQILLREIIGMDKIIHAEAQRRGVLTTAR